MSWRDSLRPGSFRGVPFETEDISAGFGRRNVGHEYPQRDVGYVEDMGRKLRKFQVVAFVIGDDWRSRRDALIEAVERGGPGKLVHPTYGTMTVSCDGADVEESSSSGRMVRVSMTFTEAGELTFPTLASSSSAGLGLAAAACDAATVADFAAVCDVAGPPFVLADAVREVTARVDEIRLRIRGFGSSEIAAADDLADALDQLDTNVDALLRAPADLAQTMVDTLAHVGELAILDTLAAGAGAVLAAVGLTPTAQAMADNAAAIQRLKVRAALAAAARVVAGTTFASYDEAVAIRDRLADRLAVEAEAATDDDAFAALLALRLALVEDVELRAANLAHLRTVAIPVVSSTLELACELYGDATREAEIEARNLPPHPGFLTGAVVVADV